MTLPLFTTLRKWNHCAVIPMTYPQWLPDIPHLSRFTLVWHEQQDFSGYNPEWIEITLHVHLFHVFVIWTIEILVSQKFDLIVKSTVVTFWALYKNTEVSRRSSRRAITILHTFCRLVLCCFWSPIFEFVLLFIYIFTFWQPSKNVKFDWRWIVDCD